MNRFIALAILCSSAGTVGAQSEAALAIRCQQAGKLGFARYHAWLAIQNDKRWNAGTTGEGRERYLLFRATDGLSPVVFESWDNGGRLSSVGVGRGVNLRWQARLERGEGKGKGTLELILRTHGLDIKTWGPGASLGSSEVGARLRYVMFEFQPRVGQVVKSVIAESGRVEWSKSFTRSSKQLADSGLP